MNDLESKRTEGWMGEKRPDQKRYHYIVDTRSLCGRLGFYFGELVSASMGLGEKSQHLDCAECFKRLKRRMG